MTFPTAGGIGHQPGQLLAGPGLSLHAHGDDKGRGRQLSTDGIGLFGKGCVDLSGGGGLRQPLLGEFDNLQLAVAGEPFGVFRHSVGVELFLQLSYAENGHFLHTALLETE